MRPRLVASVCLLGMACSSAGGRPAGGTGGTGTVGTGGASGSGGAPGAGGAGETADAAGGIGGAAGSAGSGGSGGGGNGGSGGGGGSPGGVDAPTGKGDGSRVDGTAADSATGAAAGCAGVMASFCDDFEDQATGQAPKGPFTVAVGGGAAFTIETSKPYSGGKSAHIHVPRGAGGREDPTAQMAFRNQFPVALNDLHGRVMVFLTKNPNDTNNPNIHWDLLSANGGGKTYTLGSMYNDRAKAGAFMPVYQPGDRSIDTSTPFPEGTWACVQWEFRLGGTGGDLLEIKMNGRVIDLGKTTAEGAPIDGGHIAAWPAGPWSRMVFGYVHFSSPTPIDVDLWFDDLAFGPQEIPCPPSK